jgi:hypothetical protein
MSRTRTQALGKMGGLKSIILASAVIVASTIPAFASACTSRSDIAASRVRWARLLNQPANASASEASCRLYTGSFYELVILRQDTASCVGDADQDRKLAFARFGDRCFQQPVGDQVRQLNSLRWSLICEVRT